MLRQLFRLLGPAALSVTLSLPAAAQEYSNGSPSARSMGPAIATPVEAYGVNPPGYTAPGVCGRTRQTYIPYYAPLSPTPTFTRWAPTKYAPLHPYYTPYYFGYSPHRLHCPKPPPYGYDGGWGKGPMPEPLPPEGPPPNYGPYTSVLKDATTFWRMGGNGLVPYGAPRPPHDGPPDLVDMIQAGRAGGGACHAAPLGPAVTLWNGKAPPAIMPPAEDAGGQDGSWDKRQKK